MTAKIHVKKAVPTDFAAIYPLLLKFNSPHISKEKWQRLFSDYWSFQPGFCGYTLNHGEKIVGFFAYILSEKLINGHMEKWCNLSSWIVADEFRSSSMDLLYPVLDLNDYTITSLTANPGAFKIQTKLFHFKILDTAEVFIPALLTPWTRLNGKCHVITGKQNISPYLSPYEQKVFQDHRSFDCIHLVVTTQQGYVYLICRRIYRKHLPFAKIYYISNSELFLDLLPQMRFNVPWALKTAGIIIDQRFLRGKSIPFAKAKSFYTPILYKSQRLLPHEIDSLYSELFLLEF